MFNSMIIKDVQVGFFDEYQNYNIFALGMDYRLSVYPELNIAIGSYCEIFLNSLKIPILIGIFYTVKLDYGGYILFKLKFNKIKILFGLNYNNGISYTCFISSYINNAFLNINLGSDIRGSIQSKDKNRLSSLNQKVMHSQSGTFPVVPQSETIPIDPQRVTTKSGTLAVIPQSEIIPMELQSETLPVAPQRIIPQVGILSRTYQDQCNIVIENYDLGDIEFTPLSREISGNFTPNNNQVQGDIIQSFVSRDDGAQPEVLVDRSLDEEVFDGRNHKNQTQTNLAQLDLEEDDDTQSEILVDRSVEAEGGPVGQRFIRVTRGISTENNNIGSNVLRRCEEEFGSQDSSLFMLVDTQSESVFNQHYNNSHFLDSTLNSNGLSELIDNILSPKDFYIPNYMTGAYTNNFLLDSRNSHIKNQNKFPKDRKSSSLDNYREEDLENSFITVSTDLELDETTIKIKRIVKNIMNKKTIKKRIMHYPIIIRSRNTNYMSSTLSAQLKNKNKIKYIKKEKNKNISPKKLRKTRPKTNYMSPTTSSNNKKVEKKKLNIGIF